MRRTHCLVFSAALGLSALAVSTSAQDLGVPGGIATTPPASIRQSCGLATLPDGRLVGLGDRYLAEFGPAEVRFTPALGKAAPHDLPLVYELTAVGRGDELAAATRGMRSMRDRTVEYDRGNVVETYEVRAEGLKQSFVFHRLPAGNGDLVVRGRTTSELQPGASSEQGVAYTLPGIGGVQIGAVLGFDAAGRQVRGSLRTSAGGIEFRLPADFVTNATLPIVLDPLVTPSVVLGGANDDAFSDVSWDATNDCWLVVWQRYLSATNSDVRGQRLDTVGALIGGTITIESNSATVVLAPRVANIAGSDAFVVAYSYGGDVFAKGVNAATGAVTAEVTVASGSNNQAEVDIGGEATEIANGAAAVVWSDITSGSILLRKITYGGGVLSLATTQTVSSAFSDGEPAISRSGGENGRYLLTWTRTFSATSVQIRCRMWERNGTFPGTSFYAVTNLGLNSVSAVDGDGNNWLVAYSKSGVSSDIFACSILGSAASLTVGSEVAIQNGSNSEYRPSVGWLGKSALVAWEERQGPGNYHTYVLSVDPFLCTSCEGVGSLGITPHNEAYTRIATKNASGSFGARDAAIVWHDVDPTTLQGDIYVQRYRARHGAYTELGGGCGNGGTAWATCARNPNSQFNLRLRGGPALTPVWGVLGFERNDYVCGPCTVIANPFTGIVWSQSTDTLGDASLNLPILVGSGGSAFYLQYLSLGGACSLGIEASTALRVGIEN